MSSCGNPSVEGDALMTRRTKYDRSKACVRCKLKTGNIVIRHAVYCKDCFFPLISLRFRRTLELHINPTPQLHRRKGLKASGNLLVGFSGGLGSTVLLDLVHKTYITPVQRQDGDKNPNGGCPWPEVFVAFVDTSGALSGVQSENYNTQQVVESASTEFKHLSLKLEDAFDPKWWRDVGGYDSCQRHNLNIDNEDILLQALSDDTTSPTASLQTYITSLPTSTAVTSAIKNLVRVLLLYTAASNRCSHLILGTSLTSLSISLISSISQGGGYSVKEEAQEEWTHTQCHETADWTMRIIRPLRDVGTKECAFWAWWSGLKVVRKHRYSGGRQDIGALTREFIMGLEKDYPSTVSTIARTCNKLTTKTDSNVRCFLCERPVQSGIQEWKQKISIRSYLDDQENWLPAHVIRPTTSNLPTSSASTTITSNLCYSCHTTWTSKSIRGGATNTTDIPAPIWTSFQSMDGELWNRRKLETKDIRSALGDLLLDP